MVGVPVTAWIDGNLCGQGITLDWQGQVVYTLDVFAKAPDGSNSCGEPGQMVTFRVGDVAMVQTAAWNNSRVWRVALSTREIIEWNVYPTVLVGITNE